MRWSLPVSVDTLALVAGLVWLAGGVPGSARTLGRWLTLVTVIGSVVLNAVGHLVSTGHVTVGPGLVIAVSAVPPLAAALAVHLAAATAQGEKTPEETGTATVSPIGDSDMGVPERAETDTAAPQFDTAGDTGDTPAVPECAAAVDETGPGEYAVTMGDTTDTGMVPEPGGRLSDAELDAVVVVLTNETAPPRSYNELEARFRELGYVASAARLRAAWKRATDVSVH